MDLIDQIVLHETFGEGKVIKHVKGYITILFSIGEKRFLYPSAFKKFLKMKDDKASEVVQADLSASEARKAKIAEEKKKRLLERQMANLNAIQKTRKPARKRKAKPRPNIAFKCNFCDGGKSLDQVGFDGVCSDAIIRNNIEVEKRTWCSDDTCACRQYLNGEITRTYLDERNAVCYESEMLRDWKAYAGVVQSGDRKNEPMKLRQVRDNSLCVLTTRDPGSDETDRYIFAVFFVDEAFEGNDLEQGYVTSNGPYKIKLTPAEAHKMLFWNYHANANRSHIASWSSGLHRYFEDNKAVQILRDIAVMKTGTADEKLAQELLEHFVSIKHIDIDTVPEKNGALMRSE